MYQLKKSLGVGTGGRGTEGGGGLPSPLHNIFPKKIQEKQTP